VFITALLILLSLLFNFIQKSRIKFNRNKLYGLLVLLLALFLWFIKSPNPRFGAGIFMLFPTILAFLFLGDKSLNKNILNAYPVIRLVFILCIILFSKWNLTFINQQNLLKSKAVRVPTPMVEADENFGVRPTYRGQCWLVPNCSPHGRPKPQIIGGYMFFIK